MEVSISDFINEKFNYINSEEILDIYAGAVPLTYIEDRTPSPSGSEKSEEGSEYNDEI